MSIQLRIKKEEEQEIFRLGGRLLPDGKTWVIPDEISDINRFKLWLPQEEGFIVQRPYFVLRAKCRCKKCKQETPVVALGAKNYQELVFETSDEPVWRKAEGPVLFTEVEYLDATISRSMQENYAFYKKSYSKELEQDIWGNCCIHCDASQEENDDWRYDFKNPFSPLSVKEAKEIRINFERAKIAAIAYNAGIGPDL